MDLVELLEVEAWRYGWFPAEEGVAIRYWRPYQSRTESKFSVSKEAGVAGAFVAESCMADHPARRVYSPERCSHWPV